MAVLIEGYSVVIRNSTIASKYPGGVEGYGHDCPNNTFCTDGVLCRVGFMVERDADHFVAKLAVHGFEAFRDAVAHDVAQVSQGGKHARPCIWLELAEADGLRIAWLTGTDRGEVAVPDGWKPGPGLQLMSEQEARERMEFVRTENGVDVYRDKMTGQLRYVGRTGAPAPGAAERHDELYRQATQLIDGLLLIDGRRLVKVDGEVRRRLDEAIPLLVEVTEINPGNWAAMWVLGKVYQRKEDCREALRWFSRSHKVNPDHADIAREASIAAMEAGEPQEAIAFCRRAIECRPEDVGLQANLALALLFSGQPAEAHAVASEALRRDPSDAITAHIARIAQEVVSGERPCPHNMRETASAPTKRPWWKSWK